jgi:ATP-dependent exoDNAse (exonuclease V) beta subunit
MPEDLIIVPAGAGSGKTFRIKTDVTEWVRTGLVDPARILAVTFTEAAAAELRGRIRSSLLAEGMVEQALAVEQAYVSTIHGLGLRILTENALAAGASPQPRALQEPERDLLIRQALADAPSLDAVKADLARFGYLGDGWSHATAEDGFRRRLLATIDLLRGLGDSGTAPRLIEAAIARLRGLYGPVAADPVPLETTLRQAVAALLSAFPTDLTAHVSSETGRKAFAKDFRNLKRALRPGELARDWRLWVALTELRLSKRGAPTPEGYDELAVAVIEAAGAIARHPGPLADACDHLTALVRGAQETMACYAEMKRAAGVIDYADMICDAERLLRTRPEILAALLAEVDCVIIDEFQDTNPVQFALLWRIARAARRVLIVGDTKQSIMGFQGADPRLSEALEAQHPEACAPLTGNWRSDPRLMDLINAISAGLFGRRYTPLEPQRHATGEAFVEVLRIPEGRRSRKSRPEQHIAAHVAAILDEARPVADRDSPPKSPLMRPVAPGDIALLCPTHAMAARYAAALTEQGVPVRISAPGWLDAPAVMAARQALALVADPADAHAALCLLTLGPAALPLKDAVQALTDDRLFDLPELAPLLALATEARLMPLQTLLPRALDAAGIPAWAARLPDAAQAHADLLRLTAELADFAAAHRDLKAAAGFYGSGAQVFLGWLEARRNDRDFDRRPDPGSGQVQGVEIVTWHASKGREWPITAVVGLDDGIGERPGTLRAEFSDFSDLGTILDQARLIWTPDLPLKEKTAVFVEDRRLAVEADARRLLYVALTRARDRLILEWPDFALRKMGEGSGPASPAEMLITEAGLSPEKGALRVGAAEFPARVVTCPSDPPALRDPVVAASAAPPPLFGQPRRAMDTPRTPWRSRPSQSATVESQDIAPRRISLSGPSLPPAIFASATERGTALHLALRVLLTRPDQRSRLSAATGLDEPILDALAARAQALKDWLTSEGYTALHCEVAVQFRDPSGAEVNGVVDLLAEGAAGRIILDHKSGGGRFADYYTQLAVYSRVLGGSGLLAIHWIEHGTVESIAFFQNEFSS